MIKGWGPKGPLFNTKMVSYSLLLTCHLYYSIILLTLTLHRLGQGGVQWRTSKSRTRVSPVRLGDADRNTRGSSPRAPISASSRGNFGGRSGETVRRRPASMRVSTPSMASAASSMSSWHREVSGPRKKSPPITLLPNKESEWPSRQTTS